MNTLKCVPIILFFGMIALYSLKEDSREHRLITKPYKTVLSVKATGYGKEKTIAIENAEMKAMEMILFKGIPGSALDSPLVPEGAKSKKKYSKYFNNLLKNKRYKNFVLNSSPVEELDVQGEIQEINVDLSVNVQALKKDLEENNIISI